MKIVFYAPYHMITGTKYHEMVSVSEQTLVKELIEELILMWPQLEKHFKKSEHEYKNVSVVSDDRILSLEDQLGLTKEIKILGPLSGG